MQAYTSHLAPSRNCRITTPRWRAPWSEAPTAEEVPALLDRLQPKLPMLAANLAIITSVLITYRADLEQLLVLLPGHRDDVGH